MQEAAIDKCHGLAQAQFHSLAINTDTRGMLLLWEEFSLARAGEVWIEEDGCGGGWLSLKIYRRILELACTWTRGRGARSPKERKGVLCPINRFRLTSLFLHCTISLGRNCPLHTHWIRRSKGTNWIFADHWHFITSVVFYVSIPASTNLSSKSLLPLEDMRSTGRWELAIAIVGEEALPTT